MKSAVQAEANVSAAETSSAEQPTAIGAKTATKQPIVKVSNSARRKMQQQQQHSVQQTMPTIQPATTSVLVGQPSPRTAHLRALKTSIQPTSAVGTTASITQP